MHYLSVPGEQEDGMDLGPGFFERMFEAESRYSKNQDEDSMRDVLCYYTDCVNYFEARQEPISHYFQRKIKEVVSNIKQFGTHERAEKNKQKLNQNIIKVMHDENIQLKITETLRRQKRMNETVERILKGQEENLIRRIQRSKRTMSKCQSVTMSFGSMDSSPERGIPFDFQSLKKSANFLFKKQIQDSDEDNISTT